MTFNEVLQKFIRDKFIHVMKKKAYENLIFGDGEDSIFMSNMRPYLNQTILDPYAYALAVEESVKGYASNKDNAIKEFKALTAVINKEMACNLQIDFPPIPVSNSMERLMFIAKYLQDPENKISDLSDILWVSERTIETDIYKLRGGDGDPLQVMGKPFIVEEFDRSQGHVYFASTAHPLFLTMNITQIIVTLKGLKKMSEDENYREYAMATARDIWQQLSSYGKERIQFVLRDLLPDDLAWYASLEEEMDNHFYSEGRCSMSNVLMMCLKNSKNCCIEYLNENDEHRFLFDVKVFIYDDKNFGFVHDGERIIVPSERILRSALSPELLI